MSTQSSYKIVVDGAKKSGKSSILRRIARNEFVEKPAKADTVSDLRLIDNWWFIQDSMPPLVTHAVCIEGPIIVNLEIYERVPSIDTEVVSR